MEKNRIAKVKKDNNGSITDVMLDNGQVCSITEAITMARNGQIDDVVVGKARNGRETLKSSPNNTQSDNLDNLPTFE